MSNKSKYSGMFIKRKKGEEPFINYSLIVILTFIICFGLIMLYSASNYSAQIEHQNSMFFLKSQAIYTALGLVVMWFVSKIDYRFYLKYIPLIFIVSMVLLLAVQFTSFGLTINGARRWLGKEGVFSFQPSEITKIAAIICLPAYICKLGKKAYTLKGLRPVMVRTAIMALGVYVLTDNLSTGIIVAGIGGAMMVMVYPNRKKLIALLGAGVALVAASVFAVVRFAGNSDSFRLARIRVWLHPESYMQDKGYQVMQGLYAIGSGGFFGKGLGNSVQKLGAIPEVQNDMILSVICEELGVLGVLVVLIMFGLLLYQLYVIAMNAPDYYSFLIMVGILAHISLQVILNVAVVTNTIPTTGITLPFFSYGGTAVVFLLVEMGIALGISRQGRQRE